MNTKSDNHITGLTDSHCHLTFGELSKDTPAVLERAHKAGLSHLLTVGQGIEDCMAAIELAREYRQVSAAIGLGPHDAASVAGEDFEKLAGLADEPKVVALGEIGLDYHHDLSPRDIQRSVFAKQVSLAGDLKLPLIIHCREAWDDCFKIFDEAKLPATPGVFHCYTGGAELVSELIHRGFYISFAGVVTFSNAELCRAAVKKVPLERLLIETDAPYLAPEPCRKTWPNEPALLVHTAGFLSQLLNIPATELARLTSKNAADLFAW